MKILLPLFISIIINFQSLGQYTLIPDSNFEQALIDLKIDTGNIDGVISTARIINVKYLNVEHRDINDLTGIEDFTILGQLNCRNNELADLNITNNPLLTDLFCNNNQISNLDLSNNPGLVTVYCNDNQLKVLDFNNNPFLDYLSCGGNPLNSLLLTNNPHLQTLWCQGITDSSFSLDVSNNTSLIGIYCADNNLTNLDVSTNLQLTSLYCPNNSIVNLDISKNTKLTTLNCRYNLLNELYIFQNILLVSLYCEGNYLQELNLEFNPKLKSIWIDGNQITDVNLSDKHDLNSLSCGGNPIACLNIGASKTKSEKFSLRARNSPNLSCIDIGNMKLDYFKLLELDSNQILTKNCFNNCSSPMDTTNLDAANISLYPNPTNGNLTISFTGEVVDHVKGVLINAIGQEITYYDFNLVSEFTIEINQSSGVYFLKLITGVSDPLVYKILKH